MIPVAKAIEIVMREAVVGAPGGLDPCVQAKRKRGELQTAQIALIPDAAAGNLVPRPPTPEETQRLEGLTLETGVTHQVRVHMAAAGHPLLGDRRYDPDFPSRPEQPDHALLRAVGLASGDFEVAAPRAEFVARFAD